MKGNEDNEVNSYFWLSAPNRNEQKERSPRVWGRKPSFSNVKKKCRKRGLGWQSLMDLGEIFC